MRINIHQQTLNGFSYHEREKKKALSRSGKLNSDWSHGYTQLKVMLARYRVSDRSTFEEELITAFIRVCEAVASSLLKNTQRHLFEAL